MPKLTVELGMSLSGDRTGSYESFEFKPASDASDIELDDDEWRLITDPGENLETGIRLWWNQRIGNDYDDYPGFHDTLNSQLEAPGYLQ